MVKASLNGLSSALPGGVDTIVARATAAGPGALAVVRMSGPRASAVGRRVCPRLAIETPWKARLATLMGVDGEPLDDAITLFFKGPKSYTGEDMVEIVLHGSGAAVEGLLQSCEKAGARRAKPGEFTRRAVANGKMDLVQAEAIDDLVQAETWWQLRMAREQLHGKLSRRIGGLRGLLVDLLALIEGSLDFVDQGVVATDAEITKGLEQCRCEINTLLETAVVGERVREGVRVVIAGPTNSGKSTLFNRLILSERAIVTPHPGTTRDILEARLVIGGLPVVLVDTAGLRETDDPIEKEGVRRAKNEVEGADIVLMLEPAAKPRDGAVERMQCAGEIIAVASKADLQTEPKEGNNGLCVSCVTGEGIETLRTKVLDAVTEPLTRLEGQAMINRRHEGPLRAALEALSLCAGAPREIMAAELGNAAAALDDLVGHITEKQVLDAVFERFCVGK